MDVKLKCPGCGLQEEPLELGPGVELFCCPICVRPVGAPKSSRRSLDPSICPHCHSDSIRPFTVRGRRARLYLGRSDLDCPRCGQATLAWQLYATVSYGGGFDLKMVTERVHARIVAVSEGESVALVDRHTKISLPAMPGSALHHWCEAEVTVCWAFSDDGVRGAPRGKLIPSGVEALDRLEIQLGSEPMLRFNVARLRRQLEKSPEKGLAPWLSFVEPFLPPRVAGSTLEVDLVHPDLEVGQPGRGEILREVVAALLKHRKASHLEAIWDPANAAWLPLSDVKLSFDDPNEDGRPPWTLELETHDGRRLWTIEVR